MTAYPKDIELKMQRLFTRLSEKDKRSYAAIESVELGHGGIEYASGLFGIDPKTVRRGLSELDGADGKAKTTTGLNVTVDILTGVYATGKKCATDFLKTMTIAFDDYLPH